MGRDVAKGNGLALRNAVAMWADATTDASSSRRHDLLRDKTAAVSGFFSFAQKYPTDVTPVDVKEWQADLEARGLSPSTVYGRISRLSSWYEWALHDRGLRQIIISNPCLLYTSDAARRSTLCRS